MREILINEICNEKPNSAALGAFNASLGNSQIDTSSIKVKDIYNSLNGISNNVNTISSIGDYVSNNDIQVVQSEVNKIAEYLPKESLAYKIIRDDKNFSLNRGFNFTDKQKWVIAYELDKNPKYKQEFARNIKEKSKPSFQESRKKYKREQKKKNKGAYQPPSWMKN